MSETPTPPPPPRVLIVEDDRDTRDALGFALRDVGYEVSFASSAREATVARGFDIALLDLNLPGGNGLGVLSTWRTAGVDAPVLVITADRAPESVEKALIGLDAWDFIRKPFDLDEVERAIKESLARYRERRRIERRLTG
jgi:DNA-binding response OmpR family regulator